MSLVVLNLLTDDGCRFSPRGRHLIAIDTEHRLRSCLDVATPTSTARCQTIVGHSSRLWRCTRAASLSYGGQFVRLNLNGFLEMNGDE